MTTDNTPDKELREKIATIVEYWDFSPLQDEDSRIERLQNEIMQLITADRKRVALEVKIEEDKFVLKQLKDIWRLTNYAKIKVFIEERIAELKAQQEQL